MARLSITKCKITHSSTYRVVAKNEFGEDESSAILTVKKKKDEDEEEVIIRVIILKIKLLQIHTFL